TAGFEAPGLDAARAERDNVGEAHNPSSPKEEVPQPGHEGPSTGSPGATSQPGTTRRPEVVTPPAGGPPPMDKEPAAIPAKPEEPPGRAAAPAGRKARRIEAAGGQGPGGGQRWRARGIGIRAIRGHPADRRRPAADGQGGRRDPGQA